MNVDRESAAPPRPLRVPWTTLAAPSGRLMTYQTRKAILAHFIYFFMVATCAPFARTQLLRVIPRRHGGRPLWNVKNYLAARLLGTAWSVLSASNSCLDLAGSQLTYEPTASEAPKLPNGTLSVRPFPPETPRIAHIIPARSDRLSPSSTVKLLVEFRARGMLLKGLASTPNEVDLAIRALKNSRWCLIRSRSPLANLRVLT